MAYSVQGLDIAQWQGANVNFNAIKAAGYDFVILRVNDWRNGQNMIDTCFESNYKKAKAAGLHVGAYWFTFANTIDYAAYEARLCIEWTKGKEFDYPVFLDLERTEQFNKGRAFCDKLVTTFCDTLKNAGYYVGVYCSTFWYTNYVSSSVREKYPCWIAEWSSRCTYKGSYVMWQNSTARVAGSGTGDIDHDFSYVDFPAIIKAGGYNGYKKQDTKPSKPSKPTTKKKTVEELAQEVIAGKWSAGEERKKKLTAAGYDYSAVQSRVNELMKQYQSKSIDEIALEVIRGNWGAGATRKKKLTAAGYDYNTVQNRVNEMLKGM